MADTRSKDEHEFQKAKLAAMDRVRCDGSLSASIRAVGGELFSLSDFRTGDAYPSELYLVEKLGLSVRTVKMAVKALEAAGYFEIRKAGRCNRYRPILNPAQQVQSLHLSDVDRGKKRPEQVQKTFANRCKKGPPISLGNPLEVSAREPRAGDQGAGAARAAGAATLAQHPAAVILRKRLGSDVYDAWFGGVNVIGVQEGFLQLSASTEFKATTIRSRFEQQLIDAFAAAGEQITGLRVAVTSPSAAPAVALLGDRRDTSDARWLIAAGIPLVSARLFVSAHAADVAIKDWLVRCGRDAGGLRQLIVDADAHNLSGSAFRAVLRQSTRALRHAGQEALRFSPTPLRKAAS